MQLLRDPNAAYALVILGLLAGFVELIRPGLILPGVCGAVMVMLGIATLAEQGLEPAGVAMVVAGWFCAAAVARVGWPATVAAAFLVSLGARYLVSGPRIAWVVAVGLSAPFMWIASWLAAIAMRARWNKMTP
jgi:membrane-bound serine protease (ClpP class)